MLAPLLLGGVLLTAAPPATGNAGYGPGVESISRVGAASESTSPGSLLPLPSDTARQYHVRLTYTWKGLEKLCTEGRQILEGDVHEEFDEDGSRFVGVLELTAKYVACGEAAIGNRACLASVNILGQAQFVGSIETDESGVDLEGRRIEAGELVFHWKPIEERTKVGLSGTCPPGDASEKLKAQPDYEIYLHFRPPPAGHSRRFVLLSAEHWDGAGIVLDVSAGRREVVAIPRVAPPVVRAQPVTLDGTASKGPDLRYEWTFAARGCPPGTAGDPNAKKTGPTPTVILLCSMDVTLTVTGHSLTDSRTIPVTVVPRDPERWTTPFVHSAKELVTHGDAKGRPLVQRGATRDLDRLNFSSGLNACAQHYPKLNVDHTLDPLPSENGSWEGPGYDLAQVTDAGGPFQGYWYVAGHALSVQRRTVMSGYLLPAGRASFEGGQPFYEANKKAGTKVDAFLAAMRAHEGMGNPKGTLGHSGLILKQLRKADPARAIEAAFDRESADALRQKVDDLIRGAEKALCRASIDPLPATWRGELLFPYAGSGEYTRMTVTVGGALYGQWLSCD